MIDVDDVSRGRETHGFLAIAKGLADSNKTTEAAELIAGKLTGNEWLSICGDRYVVGGIVLPHAAWNLAIAILIRGGYTQEAQREVATMFHIPRSFFAVADHITPTNILVEFVAEQFVIYFHPSAHAMPFVAARLVGILPILAYTLLTRRRNGGLQISMLDDGIGGSAVFCSNNPDQVLIPDPIYVESWGYEGLRKRFTHPKLHVDRELKAFWRGSTTGIRNAASWRTIPRAILCEIAANHNDVMDCGITNAVQAKSPEEHNEIVHSDLTKPLVSSFLFDRYRHHIDIDGNSSSWPGLFSKLLSAGTVFKVTSPGHYKQWYYSRLIPWMHYIPVHCEMGDLVDKIKWALSSSDKAERIALAGRRLADSMTLVNEFEYGMCAIDAALS